MGRYYYICVGVIFLSGFVIRLLGEHYPGPFLTPFGEFGTFIAFVVAVHFLYEILIKKEERHLFSIPWNWKWL